jgi:Resolvase, N terminal domain
VDFKPPSNLPGLTLSSARGNAKSRLGRQGSSAGTDPGAILRAARRCPRRLEAGSLRPIAVALLCIVNTLKEKQVAFRSLTEDMDTTTASGELLFHVFGALAQYERAMTKERVVAGLAAGKRVSERPAIQRALAFEE